jgi:hypothetical protein
MFYQLFEFPATDGVWIGLQVPGKPSILDEIRSYCSAKNVSVQMQGCAALRLLVGGSSYPDDR